MDYRVTFAAQANRDLEEIVRFLDQKNPAAAMRLGHALVDSALSLTTLPRRGLTFHVCPDTDASFTVRGSSSSIGSTKPGN